MKIHFSRIVGIQQFIPVFAAFLLLADSSCRPTRYVLFKTDGNIDNNVFSASIAEAEKNYVINRFDQISVEIFTNKGERISDPNLEWVQEINQDPRLAQLRQSNMLNGRQNNNNQNGVSNYTINPQNRRYMVHDNDNVFLPLVGAVKVGGLKIYQADSLLSQVYAEYYKDVYAMTKLENRRVVIMGAVGNKILTLPYESMNLLEVLAMAGTNYESVARTDKVRIIRSVLSGKPLIQEIDLTSWDMVKASALRIEPNDVIYIEPRRRIFDESQRNISSISAIVSTVSGFITTVLTTYLLLKQI